MAYIDNNLIMQDPNGINWEVKQREPLELWLIVESNFDRIYDTFRDNSGLCNVINVLKEEHKIRQNEVRYLKRAIQAYAEARGRTMWIYLWNPADRKPRRLFIQKQILKEIRKPIFN